MMIMIWSYFLGGLVVLIALILSWSHQGDDEEICPQCKGEGVYRPDYMKTGPPVKCLDCLGSGKVPKK